MTDTEFLDTVQAMKAAAVLFRDHPDMIVRDIALSKVINCTAECLEYLHTRQNE